MDTSPARPDQVFDEHRFCTRCGYSMYLLRLDGVCPECRTPVLTSLNDGPQYRAARRMVRGLFWLQIAWAVEGASTLLWGLVTLADADPGGTGAPSFSALQLLTVSQLAILLPLSFGLSLVTSRAESGRPAAYPRAIQVWVLLLAYLLLSVATPFLIMLLPPSRWVNWPAWFGLPVLLAALEALLWASTFRYLASRLALRDRSARIWGGAAVGLLALSVLLDLSRYVLLIPMPLGLSSWSDGLRLAAFLAGTAAVAAALLFLLGCRQAAMDRRHNQRKASSANSTPGTDAVH